MRKWLRLLFVVNLCVLLLQLYLTICVSRILIPTGHNEAFLTDIQTDGHEPETETEPLIPASKDNVSHSIVNSTGMTLSTRIHTPDGYQRTDEDRESLASFLRNYPLKESDQPLCLYNGQPTENQTAHAAVFALPIESEDLQQCADSVMRVFAEYYLSIGKQEKIKFSLSNGFTSDYNKWIEGYRIVTADGGFSYVLSSSYDDSYENFKKYMRYVFAYANTLSMEIYDSIPITLDELSVGDVFLDGGSPGHVILVVDSCIDSDGNRAFLLAQGHMPAQEFELMKNPAHEEDPWYYEEEIVFPFETNVHTFHSECLRRLTYFN